MTRAAMVEDLTLPLQADRGGYFGQTGPVTLLNKTECHIKVFSLLLEFVYFMISFNIYRVYRGLIFKIYNIL